MRYASPPQRAHNQAPACAQQRQYAPQQHAAPAIPPTTQYSYNAWRDQADDPNHLNLKSLVPKSWREVGAAVLTGDDLNWSRYAVTQEGYNKYISSMSVARTGISDHSAHGKTVGRTTGIATLRTEPLPKLTLGPNDVVFNDSSARQALVSDTYKDYYGCG
jgi:hypothetical protein